MLDGVTPWPEDVARRYVHDGYWRPETLGTWLRGLAGAFPSRPALRAGDRSWTYAELDAWADRLAHGFRRRGIGSGARVLVQLPNVPEFLAVLFGLARAGAVPVLALPAHRLAELEHFADLTGAIAYIGPAVVAGFDHRTLGKELADRCPGITTVLIAGDPGPHEPLGEVGTAEVTPLPEVPPGEVAVLLVSGGTTSFPKLVPRTHRDWLYSGRAVSAACAFDATTRYLACQPIAHNWTLTHGLMATFHAGGLLVLSPSAGPVEAFPLIEKHRITNTGLVPGVVDAWLAARPLLTADLTSLRSITVGASKPQQETIERISRVLGCRLQQAFGMTEGLCGFHRPDDPEHLVLGTQGIPVSPADELLVVDDGGDEVVEGGTGELLTRGPYTIRGYYRDPEGNADAFTADGYYRTGDLVRVLPSRHIIFEGRVKDQLNRGGEKISAREVEDHVRAHPLVTDAAVVGLPDRRLGERAVVFAVAARELTLTDLRAFLRERGVAAYKHPDQLELVAELPLTPVGKVSKRALRELLTSDAPDVPGSSDSTR